MNINTESFFRINFCENYDEGCKTKREKENFFNQKNNKKIYTISAETTVTAEGDGLYIIKDAISWIDNATVQVIVYSSESRSGGDIKNEEKVV